MWKLIIVLVLVIYLLNKVSVILFRVMGRPQPPPNFRKPGEQPGRQAPKRGSGLKGGEYIDYEEVK